MCFDGKKCVIIGNDYILYGLKFYREEDERSRRTQEDIEEALRGEKLKPKIHEFLEVLKNGKWHDVKEVTEKTGSQEVKVKRIISLLVKCDFIQQDPTSSMVKLTPWLHSFLEELSKVAEPHGPENRC